MKESNDAPRLMVATNFLLRSVHLLRSSLPGALSPVCADTITHQLPDTIAKALLLPAYLSFSSTSSLRSNTKSQSLRAAAAHASHDLLLWQYTFGHIDVPD